MVDGLDLKANCPVSGLPVVSKPEWTIEGKEGGFRVKVSLIGDRIIYTEAEGYAELEDQIVSIELQDKIARNSITEKKPFIQIQDWKHLKGGSNAARQYYIDYLKTNERIIGVFFCNTSFLLRMSVKLGKRLNLVSYPIHITENYSQAILAAINLSESHLTYNRSKDSSIWELSTPFDLDREEKGQSICRVTGLEIIQKPEWTNIYLDEGYQCNIRLIGGRIINISISGTITTKGTHQLIQVHQQFLKKMKMMDLEYTEIREYSRIVGSPSKKARDELRSFINQEVEDKRMVGFWLYGLPKLLKSTYKTGLKLNEIGSTIRVVDTYKQAVTDAVSELQSHSVQMNVIDFSKQRFTKSDWILERSGYRVLFEIIGDDIIYTEPHGKLKEEYVDDLFVIYEKVIEEAGFENNKRYYRILNWTHFESTSWGARKKYIQKVKEINKLYPSAMSIVFGMNSMMSLIINISRPFLPFEVKAATDIHHAIELIEQEQDFFISKVEKKTDPEIDHEFQVAMTNYKHQMLKYMGELDWDQKGIDGQDIEEGHPFKEVFDALSIIKNDLDSVFEERNQAEFKLRQSEEKYRSILENIDDGYYEIDLEGNFQFFNETLLKLLGYTKSEFASMSYKQIIDKKTSENVFKVFERVYKTGQPETDYGYELIGKNGNRLYGETSISLRINLEGKKIGFRGVIRDRTEKKALEDELIKHRDSLEKMITTRTRELEEETIEKNYVKQINSSIYNISNAVSATHSLDELYPLIHKYLNEIIEVPNFYIGIYDKDEDAINIPYNRDQYDSHVTKITDISKRETLSSKVVLERKYLFLSKKELSRKSKNEKIIGHTPENWLGVPLVSQDKIIGIMATQSYTDSDYFKEKDLEVLISVSNQVALAIERRQALDDLHEREQKYRKLIETTSAGYWQVDDSDATIGVNQALCDMIGYDESEILGKSPYQFFKDQSKTNYKKIIDQSTESSDRSYEATFFKRNKDLLYAQIDATSIFDDKGGFKGSFAFITDISERIKFQQELKRAKEEAEEASKTTKTIIENLQAGVVLIEAKTHTITLVNQAAADMFGSTPEKIVGNMCHEFLCPNQEGSCPITDRNITVDNSEKFMFNINSEKIPILKTVNSVVMNGQTYLLESFVDITEQKKAEKGLINETIRANEMAKTAKSASKAKSEFLANMSHEIRTPINGVIGMTEILMDSTLDSNQKTYIQTIGSEADSLLGIINAILDFSKIEAGKMEIEEIAFDLRKMFEDISGSMGISVVKKGLEFLSFLDTGIPSALIGDPGRLRQIFMNLAGNAMKFTHQGEIYICGKKVDETTDSVTIKFEVKDTGIGIPKERQAAIFNSFSQADGSTTRKYGGTGLGTTISKQLVELMNGKIGLESAEGKGSKFWFTIELKKQQVKLKTGMKVNINLQGINILVVDNNPTHQYIITKYLESFQCNVIHAKNEKSALELLENQGHANPTNLIIADFYLPELDGFEFARQLRNREEFKDIPIVLLTSMGSVGDGKLCKEIGIGGYLSKPIRKNDLKITVASLLGLTDKPFGQDQLVTKHTIEESNEENYKILVVEDYPTNQQIALKHLDTAGYSVVLAENGVEAVSLYKTKQFDLILMDIQMPEMDGYEATQKIRMIEEIISKELSNTTRIPIVAMTAHAMKGYREKCLKANMDDYLTKPLKRKDLIAIVEKWLGSGVDQPGKTDSLLETLSDNNEKPTTYENMEYPMDIQKALNEFDNDKEFLNEVIHEFLKTVEDQLKSIEAAMIQNDFGTIERHSHSIKGGSANLRAMILSQSAHKLEILSKANSTKGMIQAINDLSKAHKDLTSYFDSLEV